MPSTSSVDRFDDVRLDDPAGRTGQFREASARDPVAKLSSAMTLAPARKQPPHQMPPDKPGRSGDENGLCRKTQRLMGAGLSQLARDDLDRIALAGLEVERQRKAPAQLRR